LERLREEFAPEPEPVKKGKIAKLARRKGFEQCTYCGGVIDVKYGTGNLALVIDKGKPYHKACLEKLTGEEAEKRVGALWYEDGIPLKCEYCGEYIYQHQPGIPDCPDANVPMMSPRYCKFYHADKPPYDCWYRKEGKLWSDYIHY
jgi:hypothetical protein